MKLALNALVKFTLGLLLCAALLFLPAGTLHYPGAWLFLTLLFAPMLLLGVWLYVKSPVLLERRLESRESQGAQRGVVAVSGLLFTSCFVLSALDFRFGWTAVPGWLRAAGAALQLAGYALYMEVMRENAYLSRTVHVMEGQRVIDSGLYGMVRHPMYATTLVLFLSIPLVLGSWVGFAIMLPFIAVLAVRIIKEEAYLKQELPGYAAYCEKVRYRLIPKIW